MTTIDQARDEIKGFIEKSATNAVTMVRKREHLVEVVQQYHGETLNEQIYNFMNEDVQRTCPEGNAYKFKSLTKGYGFCGTTNGKNPCKCALAAVSESNKKTFQNTDKEVFEDRVRRATETKAKKEEIARQKEIELLKSNGVSEEVIKQLMECRK